LAISKNTQSTQVPFYIHDLKGAELTDLRKAILRIREGVSYSSASKIYLLTPGTVELQNLLNSTSANGIDGHFAPINRYWPHLSIEDFPKRVDEWLSKLSLIVYLYHANQA